MMDENIQNQANTDEIVSNEITPAELAEAICSILYERKAEKIVILNIKEISDLTDIFVIANAISPMHLRALTEELRAVLRDNGVKTSHLEGGRGSKWVLLDYSDVVVHLFLPQAREYYALEEYWGDAIKSEYKEDEQS